MKDIKILCASLALSGLFVGGVIYFSSKNNFFQLENLKQSTEAENIIDSTEQIKSDQNSSFSEAGSSSSIQIKNLTIEPTAFKKNSKSAKNVSLAGFFRGDWGEQLIYAKNDRVNYQRGAYLSLVEDNQNQSPATSPGYWRLVKKFKALHEENCFAPSPGMDMGECDFTEAGSLKGLDLHGAKLIKARLNGELGAADLTGADLSGAAVLGALVISPETRLEKANLSYLQSDGNNPVVAENANLTGVNFSKANLYGAKMSNADLSGSTMPEVVLTGSQLTSAKFDQADLTKADMTYANLAESSLKNTRMAEANFEQADLSRADFTQANLQKANLAATQIAKVNFSGADFRGANLSGAQGAESAMIDNQTDFTSAICPDGVTVDGTQVTTCIGHGF